MTRITVDSALTGKLLGARENSLLCDATGRVLGVFSPVSSASSDLVRLQPQVDEEELDRRERETTTWYTTAEVLENLENG